MTKDKVPTDKELRELIKKAEYDDNKLVPYLGWFWRDLDEDNQLLSLTSGEVWIDPANKWDYPYTRMTKGDTKKLKVMIADICKRAIKLKRLLNKYKDKMKERGS